MKSRILSLAVIGAFTLTAGTAMAAPVKLSKEQMDKVVAGAGNNWCVSCNPVGKTVPGQGEAIKTTNGGGNAPPGQN